MDPHDNADPSSGPSSAPGVPRWVVILAVVCVAILLIAVLVMVLAGGDHGPGRHL